MPATVHILGIRHHGPGSARAVLRHLEATRPACVLVEGPPDADGVIPLVADAGMEPPVALLVYREDAPGEAAFYPFAEFSPEWVALRWAVGNEADVRFMDLPWSRRAGIREDDDADRVRVDPLGELARAAGYDDGERWWEAAIETRPRHGDDDSVFDAIAEAMAALREANPNGGLSDDPAREAWMRKTIREARRKHGNIAVVCGAWHAPALAAEVVKASKKEDDALLKKVLDKSRDLTGRRSGTSTETSPRPAGSLPAAPSEDDPRSANKSRNIKTTATWVPWTYDRLAFTSGYGAGVGSPGWYDHLWNHRERIVERWLTRTARLFRDEGIDCSSASVIEATRLASTLGSMRGRRLPDLADIGDATRAVFCFDSDLGMRLIDRKLLVGERIGSVPDDAPAVPLQRDLQQWQKSLRLKPTAAEKVVELDLRKEHDLARSHLLHRLALLGVSWGEAAHAGGKGTFKEAWRLRWRPEMLVRLIELSRYGTTVKDAASAFLLEKARDERDLTALAGVVGDTLLADLPDAVGPLVGRLLEVAAIGSDVRALMDATPPLAGTLRYGNVRGTDAELVRRAIDGILPRVFAGFAGASVSLDADAAAAFERAIVEFDRAVRLVEDESHAAAWRACLTRCAEGDASPGLIRGRCARLLFDAGEADGEAIERLLSRALSVGTDPADAAGWVEGFLRDSGLLLLHDPRLLGLIDDWVRSIPGESFDATLPLIRRTFATFEPAERRQIGEQLKGGRATPVEDVAGFDTDRAARVLPVLRSIYGVQERGAAG